MFGGSDRCLTRLRFEQEPTSGGSEAYCGSCAATAWSWQPAEWSESLSFAMHDAWASDSHISPLSGNSQVTTKIPPAYDGKKLRFTYEEEIYD